MRRNAVDPTVSGADVFYARYAALNAEVCELVKQNLEAAKASSFADCVANYYYIFTFEFVKMTSISEDAVALYNETVALLAATDEVTLA